MFGFSGSNNGFGNKPAGSTGFSFGQNNNNTNTQPSASGFVCPICKGESAKYSGTATTGGGEALCKEFGPQILLGSVPLDPRIGKSCDMGGGLFGNKSALGSLGSSSAVLSVVEALRAAVGDV
ncbi:BFH_collapsed_G0021220.mRNA.1.CDS.1 [Saccharomyces cerevisiae]|nr:BFH_collapsed_G0021220.mRNA.1.CDS.1 [Saccharomyces cerevisiae]